MLTAKLPATGGTIKERVEDFFVEEIPAYLPSGEGDHLMVFVEKRELTTDDVVRRLAQELSLDTRNIGYAGRKDKYAVTRQWFSLPGVEAKMAMALRIPEVSILEAKPHGNKIRTGHLHGNRFRIVIRGVVDGAFERARVILDVIESDGLPNCFGPQRFGRGGRNVEEALAWIVGGRKKPRNRGRRKLLISSLQALLFNRLCQLRLERGLITQALLGDIMKVRETGGLFVAEDMEDVNSRARDGLISATGPIFGSKMWWPEAEAAELEASVLEAMDLTKEHLDGFKKDGRGSRRVLRVFPDEVALEEEGDTLIVSFCLDSGSFATTLIAELTKDESLICPLG